MVLPQAGLTGCYWADEHIINCFSSLSFENANCLTTIPGTLDEPATKSVYRRLGDRPHVLKIVTFRVKENLEKSVIKKKSKSVNTIIDGFLLFDRCVENPVIVSKS